MTSIQAVESPGHRAAIEPFLKDPDHRIRKAALHAAARTGEDWAIEALERAAGEPGLARFVGALLGRPGCCSPDSSGMWLRDTAEQHPGDKLGADEPMSFLR